MIKLEFPELIIKIESLVSSLTHFAFKGNKAMTGHLISKAKQIIFNFTLYLYMHSNKYVPLILMDQFYKKLNFIKWEFAFSNHTMDANITEMQQLPFHISYSAPVTKTIFN